MGFKLAKINRGGAAGEHRGNPRLQIVCYLYPLASLI